MMTKNPELNLQTKLSNLHTPKNTELKVCWMWSKILTYSYTHLMSRNAKKERLIQMLNGQKY